MSALPPLSSLIDLQEAPLPLMAELTRWYGGGLTLPGPRDGRPGVYSNFVTSLDGRITFNELGHYGGGEISFRNPHDRLLMGVLRSASDAVLVGAGTLRVEPNHVWTASGLFREDPATAGLLARQRAAFGLPERMLHFFVTGSGRLDATPRVLDAPDAEVWFITTPSGKATLDERFSDRRINTVVAGEGPHVDIRSAVNAIGADFGVERLLCEGGPMLIGSLLTSRLLDHAFLSVAPQIIGSAPEQDAPDRPTWVSGYFGHPGQTPEARLLSLKLDPDRSLPFCHYALEYRS